MRIVILITAIEMSVLMLWMIYKHHRRQGLMRLIPDDRSSGNTLRLKQRSQQQSAHYPLMSESGEGQRDDRRQMDSRVAGYGDTITSSERSFARRAHQVMYKKWSQERHDSHGPDKNKSPTSI